MAIQKLTKENFLPKNGKEALPVYLDRLNDVIEEVNSIIAGIGDTESLTPVQINSIIAQEISGIGENGLTIDNLVIKDRGFTNYRRPVISLPNPTKSLVLTESNSYFKINRASGGVLITLPEITATSSVGANFEFQIPGNLTSGIHQVEVKFPAGDDVINGHVFYVDTANSNALYLIQGINAKRITMNGTDKGGLKNSRVKIMCQAVNRWVMEGIVFGSGAPSTDIFTT